jgi:ribosomal protein L40E
MLAQEMAETTGIKQCHDCGAELLERDKFCRRCGVSQGVPTSTLTGVTAGTEGEPGSLSDDGTLCRSYSSRLVNVVSRDLSTRTSSLRANRKAMRLVSMLIAVPLWLMIVLLSPLDAYVAAKAIAKQA